jgi:hypothetical protein
MNTKNEIRNVAYENSASFAYDTWPHFGLEQNFKKIVDLATVDAVTMSANVELPLAQFLDGWSTPNGFQSIDFGVGYGLRRKDNPAIEIFLGYPLYSDCRLEGYSDCFDGNIQGRFSADQFGQIFYSGPASDLGGAIPAAQSGDGVHNPNNYRYIWFELRALFDKAQTVAASTSYQDPNLEAGRLSFLQTRIEDYYLAGFGFGWETLGYQHVQSYLSGVSVYALPKMIFDSEVYEESADPNQPSTYKIFNDPNGPNNEGQMRAHWAKYGCHEGRVASTTFDVKIYMDRWGAPGETPTSTSTYNYMPQCYNADGSRNYECAIDHYVIYGRLYGHYGNWFSGGGGGEQY